MKESLLQICAGRSRVPQNDLRVTLPSDSSVGEGYALYLSVYLNLYTQMEATPVFLAIARRTSGQDLACEQAEAGTHAVQMHQCCECRTTKSHACIYACTICKHTQIWAQ